MGKKKIGHEEKEPSVVRLPITSRSAEQMAADSDSETEVEPFIQSMVACFRKTLAKKEKGEEEFITLPNSLRDMKLSSELQSGVDDKDLYLREEGGVIVQNYHKATSSLEDSRGAALASYAPKLGKKKLKKLKQAERDKTKGKDWFNMPALEMTEERAADLEVLQMRGVLDPKRFYKKNASDTAPKYFQIGTIVDNAADFYTDRVPNKDRKRTMVDELLADAEFKKFQKRKYVEIIKEKDRNAGTRKFSNKKKKKVA